MFKYNSEMTELTITQYEIFESLMFKYNSDYGRTNYTVWNLSVDHVQEQ
jgi:hypothetical protein